MTFAIQRYDESFSIGISCVFIANLVKIYRDEIVWLIGRTVSADNFLQLHSIKPMFFARICLKLPVSMLEVNSDFKFVLRDVIIFLRFCKARRLCPITEEINARMLNV